MTVASTSARFHKGSGPIGQRFDVEADALWVEGKVFHEIGQAAGVSTRQVQNWARLERWKERLEAAKRKAEALIVDRTADRLAKMALRHRRGARAIQRYAEGLLTGGPVVIDPQTGRPVVVGSGDSKPAGVEFRPIAPGELAQAAQPFSKAADLGYDRRPASAGAARPTTVSPTFVKLLEEIAVLEKEKDMTGNDAADHDRRHFLRLAGGALGVFALAGRPARAKAQTTTASPLKIGSVGAGRMGSALGALFVKAGHPVMFSSRHPENLKDLVARLGPLAQAGTVEQAVAFGDVVVMVVPYAALEEIGKAHGRALAAKPLVLDICNPIARRDGADLVKWVNEQGGAGLASAKLLPGARIVRAFNGISYRRVGEIAHRPGGLVGVPIAGDDPKAIGLAEGLIRGMGFEPVLVGGLAMGKYLLPGTPLAEEHTPAEIRQIAAGLR